LKLENKKQNKGENPHALRLRAQTQTEERKRREGRGTSKNFSDGVLPVEVHEEFLHPLVHDLVVEPPPGQLLEQKLVVAVPERGQHRVGQIVADRLAVPLVQRLRPVVRRLLRSLTLRGRGSGGGGGAQNKKTGRKRAAPEMKRRD